MNESLFLVEREDFIAFVERLYAEKIRTEKIEEREHTTVKVYGIDSDDCLCSHRWYNNDKRPDEYYIFNLPDADMMGPPRAKRRVELTPEESEIFWKTVIEEVAKRRKEQND